VVGVAMAGEAKKRLNRGRSRWGRANQGIVGGQRVRVPSDSDRFTSDWLNSSAHQPVVDIHQLRVVIVFEDELPRSHPRLLP
jgi:hypothetical protein